MTLLLLPGMDGSGRLFQPLLEALTPAIPVKLIEYPQDGPQDYDSLTDFVAGQLRPHESYILLAESFSGPVARCLAATTPTKIVSLIVVAGFFKRPNPLLALLPWLPVQTLLSLPIPDMLVRRYLLGSDADDRLIRLFKETLKELSKKSLAARLHSIGKLMPQGPSIPCSCLYLQATNDRLVQAWNLEVLSDYCRDVTVARIDGPHFLCQARPTACARHIEAHYQRFANTT